MKPVLVDLYCKAGGATRGYQDAGFYVIGVDCEDQPNYVGDEFVIADALSWLETYLEDGVAMGRPVAAFHASPPCQAHSDLRHRTGREYPELIEPTRRLLRATGKPYVIENVEGAPLHDPVRICGASIDGLRVIRHRVFESNVPLVGVDCPPLHPLVFTYDKRKAHYGQLDQDTSFVQVTGGGNCRVANKLDAMGIDWMSGAEVNEAIPPAYAEHIGRQLLAAQGIQLTVDDCIAEAEGAGS
jgi:DNA (cytosine-5)-methyltransferase 1